MTPAARVQAAIEILDQIQMGQPAERVLTGWARRSRFAGSKDRAAVRDHVYDVLRKRRSCTKAGGGTSGRALMVGLLRLQETPLEQIFTGGTYAPEPLQPGETKVDLASSATTIDLPDWAIPELQATLGDRFDDVEALLKQRASVILRVNLRKSTRENACKLLADDGIVVAPHAASATALQVIEGARRVSGSTAYTSGVIELQDASSQAAIETLPLAANMRVLDYCAGGGGKLLAMAGLADAKFFAHDANPQRMRDLPARAKRAGVKAEILSSQAVFTKAPFDLVFCDVPCSGSGSWRRDPEGKWRLTDEAFQDLLGVQSAILDHASALVCAGGALVYATCSICASENLTQVRAFIERAPGWELTRHSQWTPLDDCDGFFVAVLTKL